VLRTRNGRGLFITELIDIITPVPTNQKNCPGSGPSSGGGTQDTYASSDIDNKFQTADLG